MQYKDLYHPFSPSGCWLVAGGGGASSSRGGSFHACCAWILRVLGSTGALCHLELKNFAEAVNWCDKGLQIDAKEKKLLEMRVKADKLKVGGIISSQLAFVN